MRCDNCEKVNEGIRRICFYCGEKLKLIAAPIIMFDDFWIDTSPVPDALKSTFDYQQQLKAKKKRKKKQIWK